MRTDDRELAAIVLGVVLGDRELRDPQPRVADDLVVELALVRGADVAGDQIAERAADRSRERVVERRGARIGAADRRIAFGLVRDDVLGVRAAAPARAS